MRAYSALSPGQMHDAIAFPPDTVQTILLAAATAQAMDWASAASARAAGAAIVRFTGHTTAGVPFGFMVNLISTHAVAPTSGSSVTTGTTAGSTGNSIPVIGSRTFQIPAWSTGFSVAAASSGYVFAEVWSRK